MKRGLKQTTNYPPPLWAAAVRGRVGPLVVVLVSSLLMNMKLAAGSSGHASTATAFAATTAFRTSNKWTGRRSRGDCAYSSGSAAMQLSRILTSPSPFGTLCRPRATVSGTVSRPQTCSLNMVAKSEGVMITTSESFSELVLLDSESSSRSLDDGAGGEGIIAQKSSNSPKPLQLVFFSAPWCGPCRLTNPVVRDVMREFASSVDVYEVNTDELPDVAEMMGVVSIPTIQLYVRGEVKDVVVGCVAKNVLATSVGKVLEEVVPSSSSSPS